jgi:YHS domain-containing protein
MIRLLLIIALLFVLYYLLHSLMRARPRRQPDHEELVQDPCCQRYIPISSAVKKRIGGKDYYFCDQGCLREYLDKSRPAKNPEEVGKNS